MKIKVFLFLILVSVGFGSSNLKAGEEGGEVVIQCPDGDKYKCYDIKGATVYKGNGEAIIIIPT
jgi:hypothetical protein